MPLADGATFAGYTIVRMLGSGGMAEVNLAQHPRLPRRDALKVLPASVSADNEYRQRFNREADIAATLWHPQGRGGRHRDRRRRRVGLRASARPATPRRQTRQHPAGPPGVG